jgi:hypothetical protein
MHRPKTTSQPGILSMAHSPNEMKKSSAMATRKDVNDILGDVDDAKMLAIIALRPTVADLERASMWLSGDTDVFGAGQPLKDVASQIVTLLTEDEEDRRDR